MTTYLDSMGAIPIFLGIGNLDRHFLHEERYSPTIGQNIAPVPSETSLSRALFETCIGPRVLISTQADRVRKRGPHLPDGPVS